MFPQIAAERCWLGVNNLCDMWFRVGPDLKMGTAERVTADGKREIKLRNVCWYTNMDHAKRHEPLKPFARFERGQRKGLYPTYENYDAIEVGRLKDIPEGYDGPMGVPTTYLTRHNPDEYDLVGLDNLLLKAAGNTDGAFYAEGKRLYARVVIQRRT